MEDMRQVVARNLRRIRHDNRLTQEQLAFEASIDRSYISMLENGTYSASVTMLGKLAEALGVEPAEFLSTRKARSSR
jgi:transcriptional regulator with XRE-family HTH domain